MPGQPTERGLTGKTMTYHFRNLVFEGGGMKGVAYAGALQALGRRGILRNIVRVGGTSAGAINACLFALGFSNSETRSLLNDLDFNNFLDDDWGVLRDTQRLIERFGWYRGDYFHSWIGERVAEKLGDRRATLANLTEAGLPELHLYGTNLSTGFGEVYSADNRPSMRIADAVRISMSVPLFFAAWRNEREDVLVDGGVLNNYPIKLFDRLRYVEPDQRERVCRDTDYYRRDNKQLAPDARERDPYVYNRQTLGFRLDAREKINMYRYGAEPPRQQIEDFFDFSGALVAAALNAQGTQHLHSDDWQRTVYIDSLGVNTLDFDIAAAVKKALVQSGRDGVAAYFEWFNNRDNTPVNRC
jgi:NTE family protein